MGASVAIRKLEFLYKRSQIERFRSGELVKVWQQQYPDGIFDKDDLRIHKSQPNYHFFEFLAAILFRESMGYRTLIEKYETASHEKKIACFRKVAGNAVYDHVMADRTGVPDLFVYSPETPDWFFCEVKGAGDKLRPHQIDRFEQLYRVSQRPVYVLRLREK